MGSKLLATARSWRVHLSSHSRRILHADTLLRRRVERGLPQTTKYSLEQRRLQHETPARHQHQNTEETPHHTTPHRIISSLLLPKQALDIIKLPNLSVDWIVQRSIFVNVGLFKCRRHFSLFLLISLCHPSSGVCRFRQFLQRKSVLW